MIINISFSYDYLPTFALKRILRNDLMNNDDPFLSDDAILHICDILVKRNPINQTERRAYLETKWEELQEHYLDSEREEND